MSALEANMFNSSDAQRNQMKPIAALRLPVKLDRRKQEWVEFLVVDKPVDEVILGTNSFQLLLF